MSIKRPFSHFFAPSLSAFLQSVASCLLLILFSPYSHAIPKDIAGNILANQSSCLPSLITSIQQPPKKTAKIYQLNADRLKQWAPNTYRLLGNAQLLAPGRIILADKLNYNRTAQRAQAFGHVRLIQPDVLITAETLILNKKQQKALITDTLYQLLPSRAFGQAQKMTIDQHTQITELTHATFTTCPLRGGLKIKNGSLYRAQYDHNVAWELSSDKIRLDKQKRRVYGYNTWLYFYHVPIFYTPYFNFSLDDRESGLLFPSFGVHRSINDNSPRAYWLQPYYFNLAPNYDNTLSMLAIQDRGILLDSEFRYLNRIHQATFTLTGIHDQVVAKQGLNYYLSNGTIQVGEKQPDRWRLKLQAKQHWNAHWQSEINWQKVSDYAFYSDLPIDEAFTNQTSAPRSGTLKYNQNFFSGQLDGKLTVSDNLRLRKDAPYNYEQKPSLNLSYRQLVFDKVQAALLTDITEFQISHPGLNKPEGVRQYLQPKLQYRLAKPYGYIESKLQFNAVQYHLQDTAQDPIPVIIPQYALRGGLTFERNLTLNNTPLTQTLIPELQWLYTPYVKQEKNPLFDTQPLSLNFSNLFALNRFSGYDRIGDTHQLSTTLTTELYTPDHSQQFKAAIGQIFYFADRKVTLNNSPDETAPLSDYFTQVSFFAPNFQISNTSQWQKDSAALEAANTRLQLQLPPDFTLLLNNQASRLTQPTQKTESISGGLLWHPTGQWRFGAYMQYDYTHNLKTDNEYAIQYNNCCWSAELSLHEQQLESGVYNYGFKLVVEFKGLSTLGTPFNKRLQQKLNF